MDLLSNRPLNYHFKKEGLDFRTTERERHEIAANRLDLGRRQNPLEDLGKR